MTTERWIDGSSIPATYPYRSLSELNASTQQTIAVIQTRAEPLGIDALLLLADLVLGSSDPLDLGAVRASTEVRADGDRWFLDVSVPGAGTVHLPVGQTDVALCSRPLTGSEAVPPPSLAIRITSLDGGPDPETVELRREASGLGRDMLRRCATSSTRPRARR